MTDFKVGDTVRLTGPGWAASSMPGIGAEVTLTGTEEGGNEYFEWQGKELYIGGAYYAAELVEAANVAGGATKVVVDIPGDYESVETEEFVKPAPDAINPAHYQGFSNGAQVVDITEHLSFCAGNAIKYLARAGKKDPAKHVEDLEKAAWFVQREIQRVKAGE